MPRCCIQELSPPALKFFLFHARQGKAAVIYALDEVAMGWDATLKKVQRLVADLKARADAQKALLDAMAALDVENLRRQLLFVEGMQVGCLVACVEARQSADVVVTCYSVHGRFTA
jgi:hypothetical protein